MVRADTNPPPADLANKVYVVTGANSGIGYAAAENFASRGAALALVCRSAEKGTEALNKIRGKTNNTNINLFIADFASLRSVARDVEPETVLADVAAALGYQEAITYSFVDPALQDRLDPTAPINCAMPPDGEPGFLLLIEPHELDLVREIFPDEINGVPIYFQFKSTPRKLSEMR